MDAGGRVYFLPSADTIPLRLLTLFFGDGSTKLGSKVCKHALTEHAVDYLNNARLASVYLRAHSKFRDGVPILCVLEHEATCLNREVGAEMLIKLCTQDLCQINY